MINNFPQIHINKYTSKHDEETLFKVRIKLQECEMSLFLKISTGISVVSVSDFTPNEFTPP